MEDKGVYWVLVVVGFVWISFLYGTGALRVCWVVVTTRDVCPDVKAAWNCVRKYEYTEKVWRPLALLLWYILWAASQAEVKVYEESLAVYGPNVDKFSNDYVLFETRKKVQQNGCPSKSRPSTYRRSCGWNRLPRRSSSPSDASARRRS